MIVAALLASRQRCGPTRKYKRNQDVKIDVKLSDRVKPIQTKPQDKSEFKPELTADAVLSIEGLVSNIRNEQEAILAKLIDSTPDSEVEEKSDYYFRLGELYAKQQRLFRLKSAEAAIAVDKAKTPAAEGAGAGAGEQGRRDTAKMYLLKAVKTYKGLTDNDAFRNYPKMDMALFYYGYTLQGGKYMKEARAVYDKLLKNYPNSKYVPEAHLAFADYYFESGQLADAEARYKMVLKFPKSSAYWYAMYKMGWIHLNLQRFQEALETFFQVAQATKNDKKQEILNRAAKKDFVRAYAEIGKADKAFDAFKRVDHEATRSTCSQILADLYMEQGKSDKGDLHLPRADEDARRRTRTSASGSTTSRTLTLSMPGASNADKVAEIENLVKLYGALKGKKVLPAAEAQECHDNAAAMSGELARAYHSESAKTKNPETLAYAEKLYKVYLEVFPDAEDYAQTQYFYAELLWSRAENEKNARLQTELWENAAVAFTDVVKTGKVDAEADEGSRRTPPCSAGRTRSTSTRARSSRPQIDDKDAKDTTRTSPSRRTIPEREQKMLAAFDIYINYIKDPKDDELVGMKFLKANIYRRYNHCDEALPLFQEILDKHREHETAEYAANLLLDSYNRLQRYDDMLALADKLDEGPEVPRGQGRPRGDARRSSRRSRCARRPSRSRSDAKDDEGLRQVRRSAARRTSTSTTANPEAADNDEVLYNAGVCFEEGRSIGVAIQMFNLLKKYYPNSKITAKRDRSPRQGVRRHRVLRPRVGEAREVREEVRRREGRVRRDERRGVLPQGYRRRRQGDRGHQVLHQDVRHEEAGRGGERGVLADVDLREAGRQGRGHQAPPRLHPHVRQQGRRGQARHRAREDRPDPVRAVAAR